MRYFGTDGIRDRVNGPLLERDFVYYLGRAVGRWIAARPRTASPHVIVGRDTRASGLDILDNLAKGLSREGIRIFDGGVCPTPAIAHSVRQLSLDAGLMITASHNPASDNGIKLFGPGGCKLERVDEVAIEDLIDQARDEGRVRSTPPPVLQYDTRRHYIEFVSQILEEKALFGLRIVVDAANGATYRTTPEVLSLLGASVIAIGNSPDGQNINLGLGSEHPERLCTAVVRSGADLGIAHDGDGDRVIMCDRRGNLIDGDAIMAVLGIGWARRNALPKMTVVATQMSNLGLDKALATEGITLQRVGVGDRNVYYAMLKGGYHLGGESSGHFIAMPHLPTGDGLIAALLVLREMIAANQPVHQLVSVFQPFPNALKNLPVLSKPPLDEVPGLPNALAALESELGTRGRILLRYSGTEPKIRLLVEAEDPQLVDRTLAQLEALVHDKLR